MSETVYAYSFVLHPSNRVDLPRYVYEIFTRQIIRQEGNFTEKAFWAFQMELDNAGWELHEVERWPYVLPETVII
jgi:hypothetical protein